MIKQKLKNEFKKLTNRYPNGDEEINFENDALLMVRVLKEIIEDHEIRIKKLEKK
jgi:outer membrane protein assembly factor BamD (BamD/ComL family)